MVLQTLKIVKCNFICPLYTKRSFIKTVKHYHANIYSIANYKTNLKPIKHVPNDHNMQFTFYNAVCVCSWHANQC